MRGKRERERTLNELHQYAHVEVRDYTKWNSGNRNIEQWCDESHGGSVASFSEEFPTSSVSIFEFKIGLNKQLLTVQFLWVYSRNTTLKQTIWIQTLPLS